MLKLLRVDHRLLHGQVAFSWTKQLGADCILIANDDVVKDELRMSAIRLAKPSGVKLVMKSIDDSVEALNKGVTDKYSLLILVSNIKDAYEIATRYDAVESINLGGLKRSEDNTQISKAISVTSEDVSYLKALHEKGVELEIRMVPNDHKQDPLELITAKGL